MKLFVMANQYPCKKPEQGNQVRAQGDLVCVTRSQGLLVVFVAVRSFTCVRSGPSLVTRTNPLYRGCFLAPWGPLFRPLPGKFGVLSALG